MHEFFGTLDKAMLKRSSILARGFQFSSLRSKPHECLDHDLVLRRRKRFHPAEEIKGQSLSAEKSAEISRACIQYWYKFLISAGGGKYVFNGYFQNELL